MTHTTETGWTPQRPQQVADQRSYSNRRQMPVTAADLPQRASALFDDGYRLALIAAHDDLDSFRVVYLFAAGQPDRRVELILRTDHTRPQIPSLAGLSFPAGRFERELSDLYGIDVLNHPLPRRLVLHQHWPTDWHPMRHDAGPAPAFGSPDEPYPFLTVAGPGVYEIPVGPIHAGLRFSYGLHVLVALHRALDKLNKPNPGTYDPARYDLAYNIVAALMGHKNEEVTRKTYLAPLQQDRLWDSAAFTDADVAAALEDAAMADPRVLALSAAWQ